MKVLHLIDSGGLYGAEKVLLALVKEQLRQGLEPMILSAGSPDIAEKAIEAEAVRLGLPVKPWRMRPGLNMGETRKIVAWAKAQGFTLLHSHGYKFNILLAMQRPRSSGLDTVTTLHGYVHAKRFSKMWLYESLDRWAIRRSGAVVMVAEAMRNDLRLGTKLKQSAAVIPNGIDTSELIERSAVALAPDIERFCKIHSPVILAVGRFAHEKGFDVLLESFSTVRRSEARAGLIILGDGILRPQLEAQAKRLDIDFATLMPGYYDNVASCLNRVDLLAIPSRTEGLPITLLEAMAMNVPLVTSNVGAIPRTLGYGSGGVILAQLTPDALAESIIDVLANADMRQAHVAWAKKEVDEKYSSTTMAKSYMAVYEGLRRAQSS